MRICGLYRSLSFRTKDERLTERPGRRLYTPMQALCMGRKTGLATARGSCLMKSKKLAARAGLDRLPSSCRGNLWISERTFHSLHDLQCPLYPPVTSNKLALDGVNPRPQWPRFSPHRGRRGFLHLPFLFFTPSSYPQIFTCTLCLGRSDSCNPGLGPPKLFIPVSFGLEERGHGNDTAIWQKELS